MLVIAHKNLYALIIILFRKYRDPFYTRTYILLIYALSCLTYFIYLFICVFIYHYSLFYPISSTITKQFIIIYFPLN